MPEDPCISIEVQWPGVRTVTEPPNADLPLLGGAAFERCMAEFQAAVTHLEFPGGMEHPFLHA